MGRINLTPLRVRKRALANIQTKKTTVQPNWVHVVADIPPAQILTRQQPIQHPLTHVRTRSLPTGKTQQYVQLAPPKRTTSKYHHSKKSSKVFSPVPIRYEEDVLRKQFFSDHPWELARPRVLLETSGDQHSQADWSTGLIQPGIPLSGESVVQRQLYLLENTPDITTAQAYDVARKEFYTLRRQEATLRRISVEEAEATGANFGPSILSKGMQIENKMYDDWEKWARQMNMENESRNAAFSGQTMQAERKALEETKDVEDAAGAGRNGNSRILSAAGEGVFAAERQRQAALNIRR